MQSTTLSRPAPTYRATVGQGRAFQQQADAADYREAWAAYPKRSANVEVGTPAWMGWADHHDAEHVASHTCDMDDMADWAEQSNRALSHTILAATAVRPGL